MAKIEKIQEAIKNGNFEKDPLRIFGEIKRITKLQNIDIDQLVNSDFFKKYKKLIPVTIKDQKQFKKELLHNMAQELQANKQDVTLINSLRTFEQTKKEWAATATAKCILTRHKHLTSISSWVGYLFKGPDKIQKEISQACSGFMNPYLPYANGSCLDKIDRTYAKTLQYFKQFLTQAPSFTGISNQNISGQLNLSDIM